VRLAESTPVLEAPFADLGGRQFEAETDRFVLARVLVADADLFALAVVEQRHIDRVRKRAARELDRRAHVEQRYVLEEQLPVIAGVQARSRHVSRRAETPSNGVCRGCA
jgi:hypothetical protein